MTDIDSARIFRSARANVHREWSRPAFEKLGSRIQRALLAEEIFVLVARQPDLIPDSVIRQIVRDGRAWIYEETEKE